MSFLIMRSLIVVAVARCVTSILSSNTASDTTCDSLTIDARIASFVTAPYYATWNIDSSRDRNFFMLDFAAPELLVAARGLADRGGTHIRFGGTGNNFLHYSVGNAPACVPDETTNYQCLNDTQWSGLAEFSVAAKSPIIFGVNFFPFGNEKTKKFDPTNAIEFFEYSKARGDIIYGVENGNEINRLVTAEEQAAGLLALDDALKIVYGTDARPLLIGPDALGLHVPSVASGDASSIILNYMRDFVVAMNGKLHAVTHHEYSKFACPPDPSPGH